MKKYLAPVTAALLSLTMCMSMCTAAFAADSDSATAAKEVESVVNADGTTTKTVESALGTTVEVTASTGNTAAAVDGVLVPTSATIATGSDLVLAFTDTSGKVVKDVKLTIAAADSATILKVTDSIEVAGGVSVSVKAKDIVAAVDINASGFSGGSATIPLKVSNITKGEPVYGLHIVGGKAEVIPAVALANGVVAITTTSFSPVIIVKGTAPAAVKAPQANVSTTDDSVTSPKTADAGAAPILLVLAALSLTGACVCGKKYVF